MSNLQVYNGINYAWEKHQYLTMQEVEPNHEKW